MGIEYTKEGWLAACKLLLPNLTQEQRDHLWESMTPKPEPFEDDEEWKTS